MTMICPRCGEQNSDEVNMCSMCGDLLPTARSASSSPAQMQRSSAPPLHSVAPTGSLPTPVVARPLYNGMPTVGYLENAGFWMRVAAALIDWLLLCLIALPLLFVYGVGMLFSAASGRFSTDSAYLFVIPLIILAVQWLYHALMESSSMQGTLGKMALGIKVTDLNGDRVDFGRASFRFFALTGVSSIVNIVSELLSIGFLSTIGSLYVLVSCIAVAFTAQKQGFHDMIAGTLVVRK